MLSESDLYSLWAINSTVPTPVTPQCVHDLILKHAERNPDSPAILAWDGQFTYRELDQLSLRLSGRIRSSLQSIGDLSSPVAICLPKSRWTPVSMLAIMRSGLTAIALDITQPLTRLRLILESARCALTVCCSASETIAKKLSTTNTTLLVPEVETNNVSSTVDLPPVDPSANLFITFTSGSTGKPKGACISHENVCAAVYHQSEKLGFNVKSRVLDFAPYSFDVAWSNALHTLCNGGCLCIANDSDMQTDIDAYIDRFEVNLINITPTMFDVMIPRRSTLKRILLSGERPHAATVVKWSKHVSIVNTYGPSECTFKTAFSEMSSKHLDSSLIGKPVGANTWILQPDDPNQLMPLGEVGELWIEGPLVGQGYFNDEPLTAASFIADPNWLTRGCTNHVGRRGRVYRTGDLASLTPSGDLVFCGRKDLQVKIRGQRVELGEVEHYISQIVGIGWTGRVVAEAVQPVDDSQPVLVAFLDRPVELSVEELIDGLIEVLPRYMVPTIFVQLTNSVPLTATGKTDRRRLRSVYSAMTREELILASKLQGSQRRSQFTKGEAMLSKLFGNVLGLDAALIGPDAHFLRLGGDSIRAVALSAAVRNRELTLTVQEIMQHPRLEDLALFLRASDLKPLRPVTPFSLLREGTKTEYIRRLVASECHAAESEVEDAFPCTPLQEALFELSMENPGAYVSRLVLEIPDTVDLDRFQAAWDSVICVAGCMRSRIARLPDSSLAQVILRQRAVWRFTNSLDNYIECDKHDHMGLGAPLLRLALIRSSHGKRFFVWTTHHSMLDGWSRELIFERVSKVYSGADAVSPPSFQHFVQRTLGQSSAEANNVWRTYLDGAEMPSFPSLQNPSYSATPAAVFSERSSNLSWPKVNVTIPTLVHTAWIVLIQKYTRSRDIIFGVTRSGRDADIQGIEDIIGPVVATFPFRIHLGDSEKTRTINALLQRVQNSSLDLAAFQYIGLHQIRRSSPDAERACAFPMLLTVHPTREAAARCHLFPVENITIDEPLAAQSTCMMMVACSLEYDGLSTTVNYDASLIPPFQVRNIIRQFHGLVEQICLSQGWNNDYADLDALSSSDMAMLLQWNGNLSPRINRLVHGLLAQTFSQCEDRIALRAWDGLLTYSELDRMAMHIASRLVEFGVGPEVIVPVIAQKSLWVPVTLLAVMKAGGASVLIDVCQPHARMMNMLNQVKSRSVIIVAAIGEDSRPNMPDVGLPVKNARKLAMPDAARPDLDSYLSTKIAVQPDNALFIVFTSGSTGIPKGVVTTHANFSSALIHQKNALGLRHSDRIFDFASYAFDAAWYNMLHTLYAGATLCIPSDEERRNDLSSSICDFGATFVNLTPQVAEILDFDALQTLRLLEISGESVSRALLARLRQYVEVRIVYGPAECTVLSTVASLDSAETIIGRGVGVRTWVVDPTEGNELMPLGAIGELWIEGPLVGREYLGLPSSTWENYVTKPRWAHALAEKGLDFGDGPFYRTGDLVRYANTEGDLVFHGRADQQIKIRGQRVELGEVEHQVLHHLNPCHSAERVSVVVESGVPQHYDNSILVAFISLEYKHDRPFQQHEDDVAISTREIGTRLAQVLPTYMIPSAFMSLQEVPLTATGKIDRRQLRERIQELDMNLINEKSALREHASGDLTRQEENMRRLWAEILGHSAERLQSIQHNHCFMDVGGDSIKAMSLSRHIRRLLEVKISVGVIARPESTLRALTKIVNDMKRSPGYNASMTSSNLISKDLERLLQKLKTGMKPMSWGIQGATCARRSSSTVLLTGATGYLGTQLLSDLLKAKPPVRVIVLVRAKDGRSGLERIVQAAKAAYWWKDEYYQLITAWEGDLSKPRLGLTRPHWRLLTGDVNNGDAIDTVIHNGAVVNWSMDYETLRPANILSTFQLLEVAINSPTLKNLVYVSGGRQVIKETEIFSTDVQMTGYVQTKQVAERLVSEVNACCKIQCTRSFVIVKPGSIIGTAEHGTAQPGDFLWRFVRCCLAIGKRPLEPVGSRLYLSDVSHVSSIIIREAMGPSKESFVSVSSSILVDEFWAIVESYSRASLSLLSMKDWLNEMQRDIIDIGENHPLWPLQESLDGGLGAEVSDASIDHVPQQQARLHSAIRSNLKYFESIGLL